MRVCVTGATSGVGTNLASALRARGDTVSALVRRTSATEALYRLGCDLVEGDVTDPLSVRRAVEGCDLVVHAAARVGEWGAREDFIRVNVLGTENVLRAARDAGALRFVHVSSTAVYGPAPERVLVETLAPRLSGTPYADSKREAERVVFNLGARSPLPVTVVRPCLIYGPHDRVFLPGLAALLRGRRFVWVVDRDTPVNLVHTSNVVDVVLRAMEHPRAVGEAFNVADGPPLSLGEVIEVVCRHLRVPVPRVRVPTGVARVAARVLEAAWETAGLSAAPPLTVAALDSMARTRVVSTEKARDVLGYHPVVTTTEGLAQACDALT